MTPKISLVMIVKNEEISLKECLASVANLTSEMIIVDTGSTDRTKEIAEGFGAKIFDLEWKDDFAASRNFALSHATGDWILHLDADETLLTNKKSDLTFLKRNKYYSYLVHIKDTAKAEERSLVRLFRNLEDIKYRGRIHESLEYGALAGTEPRKLIGNSSLAIMHYGYKPNVIDTKNKSERNISILRKALEEQPDDLSLIFHLGQEYANKGDLLKAESYFIQAFEHPDVLRMPVILRNLIVCLGFEKKYDEAIKRAGQAELMMPKYGEITFQKGIYQYLTGRFAEALESFRNCLKSGIPEQDLPSTPGGSGKLSKLFTALCLFKLGYEMQAEKQFQSIMPEISIDPDSITFLAQFYLRIYPPEMAENEIRKIANTNLPIIKQALENVFG